MYVNDSVLICVFACDLCHLFANQSETDARLNVLAEEGCNAYMSIHMYIHVFAYVCN